MARVSRKIHAIASFYITIDMFFLRFNLMVKKGTAEYKSGLHPQDYAGYGGNGLTGLNSLRHGQRGPTPVHCNRSFFFCWNTFYG